MKKKALFVALAAIALIIAAGVLGGCMGNAAYFLEEASSFRSWSDLDSAARRVGSKSVKGFEAQIDVREVKRIAQPGPSADISLQAILEPLTLSIVPARFCSICVWKASCGDWSREIRIRQLSHESLWPTGLIPAALGADRRSLHWLDDNRAFRTEEAFAKDIARALYIVESAPAPEPAATPRDGSGDEGKDSGK